jgi:hypothetical protein
MGVRVCHSAIVTLRNLKLFQAVFNIHLLPHRKHTVSQLRKQSINHIEEHNHFSCVSYETRQVYCVGKMQSL